jgi:ribonuclease HII
MIRKFVVVSLACMPLVGLAGEPKKVSEQNVTKATATVQSVDQDTRSLVLRSSDGVDTLVVVGPEVRNFEQIRAGDTVSATYKEALLAEVVPRGTATTEPRTTIAKARAKPGEMPAASIAASVSSDVVIQSVDQSFDTVTFKRSDGVVRTVAVEDPKATQFVRNLKPGDEVRITYTEATAIALNKAE